MASTPGPRSPIGPDTTAEVLRERLVGLGTDLLVSTLGAGLGTPIPQGAAGVTYADKVRPSDLELHWERPAVELHRIVRVGGAWTTFRGKRFKVLAATLVPAGFSSGPSGADEPGTIDASPGYVTVAAGDGGGLGLVTVQPEGRAAVDAVAWARGAQLGATDRFGA